MFRFLRDAAVSIAAVSAIFAGFVEAGSAAGPATLPDITTPVNKGASAACKNVTNSGTDYTGSATAGQNYAGWNLANANFSGANLTGTVFDGANLTGANLTGATLGAANGQTTSFSEANLTNACLQGVVIGGSASAPGANFQFANLTCVAVTNTDITGAAFSPVLQIGAPLNDEKCRPSFANTKMSCEFTSQWNVLDLSFADVSACKSQLAGLDLSGAWMVGVQFSYYNLAQTNFTNAILTGANFYSATLSNATFTGANLQYATLSSVIANSADFSGQTRLSGATLSYGYFDSAKFNNAIFEASNKVPPASMSFADFHDADFTGAALVGVNLSGASLNDQTVMNYATIENANLSNSTLSGLSLKQATLSGVTFDHANLFNANLSGASLTNNGDYRPASLVKTNLQGVNLTNASLGGVNMTNAAVALSNGVPLFKLTSDVPALIGDLNSGWMTTELYQAFEGHGVALTVCDSPLVAVISPNENWAVELPPKKPVSPYSNFVLAAVSSKGIVTGLTVSGYANSTTGTQLFVVNGDYSGALNAQTIPRAVFQAFFDNHYVLPSCSDPKTASKPGGAWTIDTTYSSRVPPVLGYINFKIVEANSTELDVYGTEIQTVSRGQDGKLTFSSLTIAKTMLNANSLSSSTVMPNGNTYGANLSAGISLDDMLTASSPPTPPAETQGSVAN